MPGEVLTYQSNINQVTAALIETRDAAETAEAALGIAEDTLTALDEIDRNGTALENIASGLETGNSAQNTSVMLDSGLTLSLGACHPLVVLHTRFNKSGCRHCERGYDV